MATLFYGIENLYTFAGAAQKDGRNIQESDLTCVKDGVILEQNGRILWAGERRKLTSTWLKKLLSAGKSKQKVSVKKVNLKAKTVFPAFIECHTHLVFAGNRHQEFEMRNQGKSYQEIAAAGGGILSTVGATRKAKEKELLKLAQGRADEFVRQGIATLEVKSGYGLNHQEEIRLLKVAQKIRGPRVVPTFLGLHSRSPDHNSLASYVDEAIEKTLPEIKKKKLAQRVDIFVEKGFYSLEDGERLLAKAQSLGFEVTVHADQLTRTGAGAHLAQKGAVSVDHLVQVSDDDIVQLARSHSTCVLLPASDFYVKIPYPPARKLIDQGARVALSTDFNPGTAPTQDLSFVGVLARLEMKMSLPEVFAAWTVGAATALNKLKELGSLEHNKFCDFVVSDQDLNSFFYQVGVHPVRAVFKAGKQIS